MMLDKLTIQLLPPHVMISFDHNISLSFHPHIAFFVLSTHSPLHLDFCLNCFPDGVELIH